MGEEEIIYDPMETMPLTSAQDPSLDPMQSGKHKLIVCMIVPICNSFAKFFSRLHMVQASEKP
jgi:hypothetical protein